MSKFKFALNDIISEPLKTILLIVQLIFSFILIYLFIGTHSYFTNSLSNAYKIFTNNHVYEISAVGKSREIQFSSLDDYQNFLTYLRSSDKFDKVTYTYDSLYIKPFNNFNKFILNNHYRKLDDTSYVPVKQIKVNNNFIDYFNLKIDSGNFFTSKDFESTPKSAILGFNYRNIFNLGDEITYLDTFNQPQTVQVIGFLKKDETFIKNLKVADMSNLNNIILLPINNNYPLDEKSDDTNLQKVKLYNSIFTGCIIISDKNNEDSIINNIKEQAEKSNLLVNLTSLNSKIDSFSDKNKPILFSLLIVSIISVSFTIISITSLLLLYIKKQYKTLAIHLMYGATIIDIIQLLAYRLLLYIGISLSIASYCIHVFFSKIPVLIFDITSIIEFILILLLMCILIILVPSIKIRKIQLNQIIRSE